jgi:rRNA-processing protein FCF1
LTTRDVLSDAGESLPGQGEFSLTTFDLKIAAGAKGCLIDTSIIDCYLVHLAKKENLIVFTADRPLRSVAEFRGVKGIFFAIQSKELSYIT